SKFMLTNKEIIDPNILLDEIASMIKMTGDPGIIWLEKLNKRNPLKFLGQYETVSPCGEVGMIKGETCQFGYLNLAAFFDDNQIDFSELKEVISLAIRILDNGIEFNIRTFEDPLMSEVAFNKRKIGLGVCGWADLLLLMRIKYGSDASLTLAEEIMSFIAYHSKLASIELAKERGPFKSFKSYENQYHYNFLEVMYGSKPTDLVSADDWKDINKLVQKHGIRNSVTTSLPPTGRSSLILGTSPQIEPYFSINPGFEINQNLALEKTLMSLKSAEDTESIKEFLVTALDLTGQDHLEMASRFQKFTDQAISKTVNFSKDVPIQVIKETILLADELDLPVISIYVDGSREKQPQKLN
ncbi:MAG: hypothetical protein IH840_08300, partial [Candidatus Heimdallarchaeota archaeon]|nr:hypothetical protein [Candidatus Heimdallarchaeota archaeon]